MSTAPIAALQSEWSLWARGLEGGVADTARRLGVGIVAYSPLGRGFLTGAVRDTSRLDNDDSRRRHPRFTGDNLGTNLDLVDRIAAFAGEMGVSPAQLALAWVLARGDDVVPIAGTTRRDHLEHNLEACRIQLDGERLAALDVLVEPAEWQGARSRSGPREYGASAAPS